MRWTEGYHLTDVELPQNVRAMALAQDWCALDAFMRTWVSPGGRIWEELSQHASFTAIEHMLALRDSADPTQEDGIWHDDGSRVLAFSLSLNFFGPVEGGQLAVRPRASKAVLLGPYPPGKLIIFHTGQDDFEHRTLRVSSGKRLVCAGWCS